MKDDLSTLGKRLAFARKRKGWTQEQLAKEAGVSQGAIGNLESDLRARPRSLLQICSALGVSAVWLEFGEGNMLAENPLLRADVSQLAQEIQARLDPAQVAKLRDLVIAFSSKPTPE